MRCRQRIRHRHANLKHLVDRQEPSRESIASSVCPSMSSMVRKGTPPASSTE
jgi:hypothetical protein